MPAEIDRLLAEAAATPKRPVDPAALRDRARRARRRDRALAAVGVLAVLVIGAGILLTGGRDVLELAPAAPQQDLPAAPGADAPREGPTVPALPAPNARLEPSGLPRTQAPADIPRVRAGADELVRPGRAIALPPPGEVLPIWVETPEEGPVPVFVVREPGGAVHALVAAARFMEGVDSAVGWCAESALLVEWRGGSTFAPDGSYRGGPSPTGLDGLETDVDGEVVRLGARLPGISREDSVSRSDAQRRAWAGGGIDGCLSEDWPGSVLLHGLPGVPFAEAAAAAPLAGQPVDGRARPGDLVLVEGTLVFAPDESPRLCDPLPPDSPPECPVDAPSLRGVAGTRQDDRWGETGLFRAVVIPGGHYGQLVAVTADVSHAVARPEPPLIPPLVESREVLVQDGTIIVPAVDVDFGDAPEPIPAGRYALRLDNSGNLPHTLVNADLGVDLRTEGRDRDRTTVDLPPGQHLFVCEIPGHAQTMQLTLTVVE